MEDYSWRLPAIVRTSGRDGHEKLVAKPPLWNLMACDRVDVVN